MHHCKKKTRTSELFSSPMFSWSPHLERGEGDFISHVLAFCNVCDFGVFLIKLEFLTRA